jgi:hypothetical protein
MSSISEQRSIMAQTVIDHIVLLKVRDDASEGDIEKMRQGVLSLKAIPGVLTVTVGKTFAEDWMPDRRNGKFVLVESLV